MVDWINKTWKHGDKVKYFESRPPAYLEVHPGLYWYRGLGNGVLFRADGTMLDDCTPQEAHAECRRLGLTMRYVDSFACVSTISVRD